jgi:hypothetical protein
LDRQRHYLLQRPYRGDRKGLQKEETNTMYAVALQVELLRKGILIIF